ncbi:hypothetical protein BH10PSE4_BH10PSE4_24320 [soil metagenome]
MQSPSRLGAGDQRAYPRSPTTRKVYLADGKASWKCNLIDVAEGGARVALASGVPDQDGLFLVDPGTRLAHLTRQVWRSDREIGLQFIESTSFRPPLGGPMGAVGVIDGFVRELTRAGKLKRAGE